MQKAWLTALEGQICISSQWVCIDHFSPDDYTISENGTRYDLRPGAVPRIFSVALIKIDGNEQLDNKDTEFDIEEMHEIKMHNIKLEQKIEQLKSQLESEKIFFVSRIHYFKEAKQQLAKNIVELKREISNLTHSVDKLTKERDSLFADLSVNIFNNY